MAGEERDARLILQAEDRASKTFAQVAKSIKDVRSELEQQVAAAAKGEGSIDGLNKALKDLKALGDDLVRSQSTLKSFESITDRVAKAEDRLNKAKASLAAYQEQLGAGGPKTDAQTAKMDKLQAAVTRTQGSFDAASKRFTEVSDRMQRAGLAAGQFDEQTAAIAGAAREAAQGIAIASQAADGYAANLAKAQAEQRKLSEAEALKGAVAASPLGASDIAYVLSFENAMEKLRETEALYAREQRAQSAAEQQQRAAKKAALDEVLSGNQQLLSQFEQLATESSRADNATNFRKIGSDAAAAAQDLSRFGGAADATTGHVTRLAETVRGLLNPVQAASSSINGVTGIIDEAAAVADQKGTPKINAYSEAIGKLAMAQRGLLEQAGLIDSFKQQGEAVAGLEAKVKAAQAEIVSIGNKMSEADGPVEEWARDLKLAQGNLETLGASLTRERAKLTEMGAALGRAGIETGALAAAEKNLVTQTERAAAAQLKLQSRQGGKGGFLGLNPYELQNLSYQVNDVFTQIASGTPILQVAAQQGGQFFLLCRGALPMLIRFAPLIGVVVAALVVLGSAIGRANDQVQSLKEWKAVFASMGDGAQYSAANFAAAEQKLKDLGASAEDAKKVLKDFIDTGLDQTSLSGFITTATDLAKLTGEDLPSAAKLMGDAYSGGMDQINALNDATHQFTDTQLAHIQSLFDAGKADEARTEAMRITQEQTDKGITQLNGPMAGALKGAATGWHNLLDAIGNLGGVLKRDAQPMLDWFEKRIKELSVGWVAFTALLKGASLAEAKAQALASLGPGSGPPVPGGGKGGGAPALDPNRRTAGGQDYLRTQEQQLRTAKAITHEQRLQLALENARNEAAKAGASPAEIALAAENARRLEQTKINREDATAARSADARARAAENRREAAARKAEALRDKLRDLQQGVDNSIASMDAQINRAQSQNLDQRLKAVDDQYSKVFAAIDKAQQEGVSKKTADADRARVSANIVILKQLETEKYYNEQIKALTDQRKTSLTEVEDAYARGDISAAQAVDRAKEITTTLDPAIADMAQKALVFAEALNSVNPSPKLQEFIQQMKTTLAENTGGGASKVLQDFTNSRIADESQRLNNVIEQRNQLVAAETNLVELGLQTRKGAQAEIEAGYTRTQPLLDAQIASMQALLATLDQTNPAMKLLYDTWQAKLKAVTQEGTYTSATFTQLKQGIDQAITQNAMEGFDTIAKALAGLVTGGQSVAKTFGQIGLAALNFVGQTLGAIGRLILQMLILDAVQKATGIPVAAIAGAMNGSGGGGGGFLGIFGKLFHGGGIAGESGYGRTLPAAAFAGAPRYHGGGIAGLAPDETTAILRKGEEILTEENPRHRNNFQGSGSSGSRGLKQVLVMHPRDIAGALQSPEGDEVMMTFVRANRTTLKQVLG